MSGASSPRLDEPYDLLTLRKVEQVAVASAEVVGERHRRVSFAPAESGDGPGMDYSGDRDDLFRMSTTLAG